MKELRIASDFSRVPAGRYRTDGPKSGEAFREDFLAPLLTAGNDVSVHLDGVEGYGSSFLEEAFGGLVRRKGLTSAQLRKMLTIITDDQAWFEEVWDYIDNALEEGAAH